MKKFINQKWFLLVWAFFAILCFVFIPKAHAEDISLSYGSSYYYVSVGQPEALWVGSYHRPYNSFVVLNSYSGTFSDLSPNNPFYLPPANIPVSTGALYYGSVRNFDFTLSNLSPSLVANTSYKLVVNIFNTSTNVITPNLNYPILKALYNGSWYDNYFTDINSSYTYDTNSGILSITVLFTVTHNATGFYYQLNSSSTGYNGQGQGQFVWNQLEIDDSQFTLRSVYLYRTTSDSGSDVIINQNNTIINQNNTQINQNQQIITQQQTTNDKLDDINNSINDDNTTAASGQATSYFSNFQNNTHGLTGIITLPLTSIQKLTSSTCSALNIPIPYTGTSISLPCMTTIYQTYIPTIFSIWQVVSFGIISYFICVDIFYMVKDFKDPDKDKIEVVDL